VTKKGKGYDRAEADPIAYHGPSPFNIEAGIQPSKPSKQTFTQVFGNWLCDMAAADERLIGITPAMREGSGLVEFERRFPARYHDVGIAEQHAVTFAAGIACEGLKPVVAIYSTFLQRGYDQLVHDVALQNLPVVFAIDRAGMVGADGATHAGAFDIAYLRCLPNMLVMTPANARECRDMLTTGFTFDGPSAIRYPRGSGQGPDAGTALEAMVIGKGQVERSIQGNPTKRIAFICFGPMLYTAMEVAEAIDATVVNMRFVKPLDEELLKSIASSHDGIVLVEDSCVMGGAGSACLEYLAEQDIQVSALQIGLPDQFTEHGDIPSLLELYGISAKQIETRVRARFAIEACTTAP
jgi:1-deoxy-D-xylulose-5-phosphate synthase